jgi:glutathione S-transferase
VGVEIAHRAVHLGQQRHFADARAAALQARHHIGQFLADGGGAGGLAMGAAQHGQAGQLVRHGLQMGGDAVQRRQQHLLAGGLEHQAMAGVVDVLAGAGEVHELAVRGQLGKGAGSGELLLDPVLDRLDVVVGGLLDVLDGLRVGRAETGQHVLQVRARAA